MKKNLLSIMLVLALVFAVTMPVMADQSPETTTKDYATADDFTQDDSYKVKPEPTITYDDAHNITMTYSAAKLKTVPQNKDGVDRKVEAAWVGFKLTVPEAYTKYKETYNKEESEEKTLNDHTITDFVAVTKEKLENATKNNEKLVYTIKYEWIKDAEPASTTGEGNLVQTLNIVIDPKGVELYDGVNAGATDTVLWDVEDYNDNLPKATTPSTNNKKPSKKKDPTPNTGVMNVYAVAGLVAVVTLAGAVVLNKRK